MEEDIAWLEKITELHGQALVGRRNESGHHFPRSVPLDRVGRAGRPYERKGLPARLESDF
jgi:hypothetical protein